jgi:hypothetical protein
MGKHSWLSVVLIVLTAARAEETDAERDAQRATAKRIARSLELKVGEAGQPMAVEAEPLLRYTDATRKQDEAALWVWGKTGRPAAILAMEFYPKPPRGPRWLYEIASLSDQRITVTRRSEVNWTAEKPGLDLKELPQGGTPAEQAPRRLAQMRQLLRRFSVRESAVVEGALELRPMTSPLRRYDDAGTGLIDGAIFAFVNGTNPEVFVLLEAHAASGGPSVWKYSLAQMTGGEVVVGLDGKDVWKRTEADPPAVRESYANGWLKVE